MDEALVFTVVCVGPIFALGAFTALIVWLVRKSSVDSRIVTLEGEVARLRWVVDRMGVPAPGVEKAPVGKIYEKVSVSPPSPVAKPVADPVPAPVPAPVPDSGSGSVAVSASASVSEAVSASVADSVAASAAVPPQQPPGTGAGTGRGTGPMGPVPPPEAGSGIERWIGVRGAAALGAGVLVLASLYLFRYSIEHDLISPTVRVILGTLVGLTCVVASETILRLRQPALSQWLAGAGFAILYLAFWAAGPLYGLVGTPVAGVLMVLVTGACCVIAVKRQSVPVALLGLLGGFATPLLLSTGQDRPVALFSYLLVLDAALLFVAQRRRWPWLGLLALLGTTAYQGLWVVGRMGGETERVLLGMAIVVVFAGAFAIAGSLRRRDPSSGEETGTTLLDWVTRVSSVLLPFVFALYFGARAEIDHLWPTAALLTLLVAGAAFVARRDSAPWIGLSAVCAALGVLAAWLLGHPVTGVVAWEVVGFIGAVALVTHLAAELDRKRKWETVLAAGTWTFGSFFLVIVAIGLAPTVNALPWVLVFALLTALGLRQASHPGRGPAHLLVGLLLAFGISTLDIVHAGEAGMPGPGPMLALSVIVAIAHTLATLLSRAPETRTWASHGAALLATILILHVGVLAPTLAVPPIQLAAAAVVLAFLSALAATRSAPGPWMLAAGLLGATVLLTLGAAVPEVARADRLIVLGAHGLLALLLAALPFALPARLRELRWTWRGAALAPLFLFPGAAHLFDGTLGHDGIAVVPLALAALGVVSAAALQRFGPQDPAACRSATAWVAGVALALITIAVPLELENEWITIAWSLQAVALLLLWRRVDHAGLKWIALALAATVTIRLCLNPWVLDYADRGPYPVLNWLAYTYLVPFFALLASFFLLRRVEVERLRTPEIAVLGSYPRGAHAMAVAAIGVLFVWVNLAIFDAYAVGPSLEIPLDRLPARDLTISIAWAVYGLGLLALGMWRKSTALRVLSLALVLLTCAKVFLYDLAILEDLYRVASLAGLAVSLILISLAYQRFVFRKLTPGEA